MKTCKCGHGKAPVAKMGPYAGLCEEGAAEAKEMRHKARERARELKQNGNNSDRDITKEIKKIRESRRQLTKAAGRIVESAEQFEIALEKRNESIEDAKKALAKLDVDLEEFKRVARAKLTSKYVPSV